MCRWTLIKCFNHGPFTNFHLFQNIHRKNFQESVFAKLGKSGLQACKVFKCFIGIFEILEHSILSEHFQNNIYGRIFSSVVGCRL